MIQIMQLFSLILLYAKFTAKTGSNPKKILFIRRIQNPGPADLDLAARDEERVVEVMKWGNRTFIEFLHI